MTDILIQRCEVHGTDTGQLTPYFRNWDEWHAGHQPKMVYTSSIASGATKSIMAHTDGTQLLTAVAGCVYMRYVSYDTLSKCHVPNDVIKEVEIRGLHHTNVVKIPPKTWYQLWVPTSSEPGVVMNMPSLAWRPDYSDKVTASTWNDAKAISQNSLVS